MEDRQEGTTCGSEILPLRSFAGLHNGWMTRCGYVLIEVLYRSLGGAGELRIDEELCSTC
jgi:hypothetical protein